MSFPALFGASATVIESGGLLFRPTAAYTTSSPPAVIATIPATVIQRVGTGYSVILTRNPQDTLLVFWERIRRMASHAASPIIPTQAAAKILHRSNTPVPFPSTPSTPPVWMASPLDFVAS